MYTIFFLVCAKIVRPGIGGKKGNVRTDRIDLKLITNCAHLFGTCASALNLYVTWSLLVLLYCVRFMCESRKKKFARPIRHYTLSAQFSIVFAIFFCSFVIIHAISW